MKNSIFNTISRVVWATLLGFVLATALAVLLACITDNDRLGAIAFLLGWPFFAWRRLRKPPAPAKEKPTLARRAVLPLVALPFVLAIPVFIIISAVDGGAGGWGIVAIITVIVLSSVFMFSWAAAFAAYIADVHIKKKR
ncbi:hypothetical protein [Duganella sp. Root1480D1]|uniref:hypothetical protein n=1 Tax=Duganella sp. Root1480D1 TaxID=1736471 RepID=UPI0007106E25|nr:hypothetical protein [Duganella sp. Root1480D1]KQZ45010.1 hypothetical protein ASD58_01800 [Duganella sp. Root1480D1]